MRGRYCYYRHHRKEGVESSARGRSRPHVKGGESRPSLWTSDPSPPPPGLHLSTSNTEKGPGQRAPVLSQVNIHKLVLLHAPVPARPTIPAPLLSPKTRLCLRLHLQSEAASLLPGRGPSVATPLPPPIRTRVLVGLKEGPFPELGLSLNYTYR